MIEKKSSTIVWSELSRQHPREIVLSGESISDDVKANNGELDKLVYKMKSLNFLEITNTPALCTISSDIVQLENLTNLVLQGNMLETVPVEIGQLCKLKCLDLSRNAITHFADNFFLKLEQLQTLNLEQNKLESLPDMSKLSSLLVFKFSSNQLKEFPSTLCDGIYKKVQDSTIPIYGGGAVHLSELIGSHNQIEAIPASICRLVSIKTIDLRSNQIKLIPGELSHCGKLKELNLKDNPVKDRRLYKLIEQCPTKKVLDYIRANVPLTKELQQDKQKAGDATGGSGDGDGSDNEEVSFEPTKSIVVQNKVENLKPFKVIATKLILQQRKIVACILHNLDLSNSKVMKKFIAIQTKLHQGICDNRQKATIATHDFAKIIPTPPSYASKMAAAAAGKAAEPVVGVVEEQPRFVYFDGKVPTKVKLTPLGRSSEMTGMELYRSLNEEADQYRKEKKRNTISGVHKYLHLLKGKQLYPVVLDYKEQVISLPPLTNADFTKLSPHTNKVFVEVTGESVPTCRMVMNELIHQLISIEAPPSDNNDGDDSKPDSIISRKLDGSIGPLVIEPVVVESPEGELVVKYPSKIDLQFDDVKVEISK